MANKIIRLTESELHRIVRETTLRILEGTQLLTEMPYERKVFLTLVDTNAKNAYIHLAKIFLYGNSTNDANKWANEIVNKFTIPFLLGKVHVSNKARTKILVQGYIENLFGENFEDYELHMENFCATAIADVEDKAKKENLPIPTHNDIKQAMECGRDVLIAYANAVSSLSNGTTQEEANRILQNVLRKKVNASFNLNI